MPGGPFDASQALLYGRFVASAYTMYDQDSASLTPQPSNDFPQGYTLTAWVQMRDFILDSTDPVFYGFIAHSDGNPNQAVLAIRGTSNGVEWWDDSNSLGLTAFKVPNCGNVGLGFERIYDTLEIVERPLATAAAPQSLSQFGSFSAQVAAHLARQAQATASTQATALTPSIGVTGHSLGAALATYYAAENALVHKVQNPVLCTFASPKVGDQEFVSVFNGLGLTSWRVVNKQDIVPLLPPLFSHHVNTEQLYDSDNRVQPGFGCWHAIATYLHLIDSSLPLDAGCQPSPPQAVAPQGVAAS
jgi:predicted lipase